jgi:hypothetical protein
MLSAPQIVYKALYNRNPAIDTGGSCRLCGGPLLGDYRLYREFEWDNWTGESFNKDNTSVHICEACQKMRNFRDVGGIKVGKGFIATEQQIKFFQSAADALAALYDIPEPPLVLAFIPYSTKAPLTFYLPVSLSKEHINALIAFNRGRTFRLPPLMRNGRWNTLTPIAEEIYIANFKLQEIHETIEFLQKQEEDALKTPEFRDLCLYDPVWGLCAWLTNKDRGLYTTAHKKQKS